MKLNLFTVLLIQPMVNILVLLYQAFIFLHIPYALGFSIIALTVLIRLILHPLTASQLRASRKMQQLAPHMSKIKEKHKADAQRQQQEMMALYKEHGVNPAAGCLPTLLQFPILISLYSVLQMIVKAQSLNDINKLLYVDALKLKTLWDPHFFGLPLAKTPGTLFSSLGILIFLIPVLTAVLQFVQTKMMMPQAPVVPQNKKKEEDFATAFQTQSMYMFPLMIGFMSYNFPIGLSLYWNTSTIFGIIQQYKIQGLGSLEGVLKKIKK